MPEDAGDEAGAKRAFLKKAASILRQSLQFRAPGPHAAEWSIHARGDVVTLSNNDIGAYMTQFNKRHPIFAYGPRDKWDWCNENVHQPEQTNWAGKAVEAAIDDAADNGVDEYLREISITSDFLNYR